MLRRQLPVTLVLAVLCAVCVGIAPSYAAGNPPTAQSDSLSVAVDQPATVVLLAFDDEDDPLTYAVFGGPAHGVLTGDCSDGECTYTPDPGYTGVDSFGWSANDGTSTSNDATISIEITDPDALEAFDTSATLEAGSAADVELSGFDPGGHALAFEIVTPPTHGTLGTLGSPVCDTGSCSTTVTYTSTDAAASDSFTYRVSNATRHSPAATASLQITPATGAHITSAGPLTSIGISPLLNCSVHHVGDSSGEFFGETACGTFVALGGTVYGPASIPAGGVGQTAYTPLSQTKSGSGTAASPFEIHTVVNVVPGVNLDQVDSYVVGQESYRTSSTLVNTTGAPITAEVYKAADCYLQDSDTGYGRYEAATGAIACVGVGEGGPSSRIEQFFPLSSGSSYYEAAYSAVWSAVASGSPLPNLCQQCSNAVDNGAGLSWSVSVPAGGSASRSHLTTFSPLGISPLSTTKTADSASAVGGHADGYTITVTNPNSIAATLTTITDDLPTGFSYTTGSTTGVTSSEPTVTGQKLTWSGSFPVPAGGHVNLHFGVLVSGTAGTFHNNAGGTAVDLAVVPTGDTAPVTVTANHNPSAVNDAVTTAQNTPSSAVSVIANDTDADGDTLTVTGKTNGAHGTVTCTTTTCTYTPAAGYNGADSFTYTISDGHGGTATGTVAVTVTAVDANHPPAATADTLTTAEDTVSAAKNVVANDTDADGDTLAVSGKTNGAHGTVTCTTTACTYTPAADYNGADSFTYTISDGQGGTATGTVTVTVTPVNDNPHVVADAITTSQGTPSAAKDVVANDTDADGDTLTVTAKTNGAHGTVTCTTTACTYTPAAGYNGADSFTYTISDGHGGTDTGTVTVTITPVNDNPHAVADAITTAEDTASAAKNVVSNDTDADGDTLTVTGKTNGAHGTVTCTTTTCTYTPAADYNGADSFTYTISDGHGGTDTGTVTVTVTPVNDNPHAVADAITTAEDTASAAKNVVSNDTDADGDTLTVTGKTNGAHGTVTCATSTCTYTPAADYNGADSFTYTISDGHGGTDTGTVTVTVPPVNDNPHAVADAITTAEDTASAAKNVVSNDTDADGDTLAVSGKTNGAHGTVTCTTTTCTYTPAADYNGTDSFTYTISDGHGGTDTGTVTVTVTPVNDTPHAFADAITTSQGTPSAA
ncbi:tandem-95 repeat protein, partial [Nocardioides sp. MAH-18]